MGCKNSQNSVSSSINTGNSRFCMVLLPISLLRAGAPKESKLYIPCGDHFEEENPGISSFLRSNMVSGEKKIIVLSQSICLYCILEFISLFPCLSLW